MGGPTSGPQHNPNSERSRAKGLSGVVGTGSPELREDVPPAVAKEWHNLVMLTSGITFEQDSEALLQMARLIVRNEAIAKLLDLNPADDKLNATSLAIGRQMLLLSQKLGLTPRDRQMLIRPKPAEEAKPVSRLAQLRQSNSERIPQ